MRFLLSFLIVCAAACPSYAFAAKSEHDEISGKFIELFQDKHFGEINALAEKYRSGSERTSSGDWKLAAFYAGVKDLATKNDDEDYWKSVEVAAKQWIEDRPSPMAHIVYADLLINHAAKIHGDMPDSDVDPDRWWPINRHLARAQDELESCKDRCDVDPEWYVAMISLAKAESWDASKTSPLYSEAVKRHPYYDEIYYHIADILKPAGPGGSYGPLEDFANNAVSLTGDKYGYGMYARIYSHISECTCSPKINIFETTMVNWRTMKAGIDDILKDYPDQWNLSRYAYFACVAGDGKETRDLTDKIKVNLTEAWNGEDNKYQLCKRMSH